MPAATATQPTRGRPARRAPEDPALRKAMRATQRTLDKHTRAADAVRPQRDRLIHQAIDQGWTHAQIADLLGIKRSRVGQIALRRP